MTPAPVLVIGGPAGAGKSTVSRMIAEAFDPSVHLRADDIYFAVVNGQRDSEAVSEVLAHATMTFAGGGYTTVLDGMFFPEGAAGLAAACADRGIRLTYVVLAADLETCRARARQRDGGNLHPGIDEVHARYRVLPADVTIIDSSGPVDEVVASVLAAFDAA